METERQEGGWTRAIHRTIYARARVNLRGTGDILSGTVSGL